MRRLLRAFAVLVVLVVGAALFVLRGMLGGGQRLEDRTTEPALPASAIEVVADLELPPGNIAVSREGRVFFTFHPEAGPSIRVAELVNGEPVAYPDESFQRPGRGPGHFQTPLSLRIDSRNRLWVLDYGRYGFGQPRLFAFDLRTNRLVDTHDFSSSEAGLLSMLNDFQIDPDAKKVYIADSSLFGARPALLVYDVETNTTRRLLEGHASVVAKPYVIDAAGRQMRFLGVFTLRIGVDSIALDKRGEWLYYAPVNDDRMYRIATRDLNDAMLTPEKLAAKVESFGPKTLSDGLTMDLGGNVYVSDMEHSAILALGPDRRLRTIAKDPKLRWPDGMSFGPEGWLYVACSSLQHVILRSARHIRSQAPYQIFRFKPGLPGVPGQ